MAEPVGPIVDATEQLLGIRAYLSPQAPGFSAVLKGRYSDFVVREGTLLCQTLRFRGFLLAIQTEILIVRRLMHSHLVVILSFLSES